MNHPHPTSDYEGHGVYVYGQRDPGLGQLPTELAPLEASVVKNGLKRVAPQYQSAAVSALETMSFSKVEAPEIGGVSGSATYVLGEQGSAWVSQLVSDGYVVMVDPTSPPAGVFAVMATDQPASVALFAGGEGAKFTIVDADPEALAAAEAYATGQPAPPQGGGQTAPQGSCPEGQVEIMGQCLDTPPCPPGSQEVYGACFPLPPMPGIPGTENGGGQQPPPGTDPGKNGKSDTKEAGMPSWALPAAAVVGVAAIAGIALSRRRPASPRQAPRGRRARPNRGRRQMYPAGWK